MIGTSSIAEPKDAPTLCSRCGAEMSLEPTDPRVALSLEGENVRCDDCAKSFYCFGCGAESPSNHWIHCAERTKRSA